MYVKELMCMENKNESKQKMNVKVLIIGAGASGIAAAARLLEKGISDILILEAENRIGGRVFSTAYENSTIDIGGQWVHGEKGNVVYNMAAPLDLLTPSELKIEAHKFCSSSGKEIDYNSAAGLLQLLMEIEEESVEKFKTYSGSVGEYFEHVYKKKLVEEKDLSKDVHSLSHPILKWFEKFKNSVDASNSWFITSGFGLSEYWDCEGNLLISWKKGGFSSVLDLLMKKYPDPSQELPVKEKILLNKEVVCIQWDNFSGKSKGNVLVECADLSSYIADYVIITTSLGVLKERAYTMFQPMLPPPKLIAIKGLEIGIVDKIFLKFPSEWWLPTKGFNFVWSKEDYCFFSWKTSDGKDGRWLRDIFVFHAIDNVPNVLLGWIVGTSAIEMENWSDADVLEGCMEILTRFCGKLYNIPQPTEIIRSKWYSNPHFRGSYSFRSMDTEILNASAELLSQPVRNSLSKEVLFFGGEATHKHYYSTVHGAIESGWREGERVAAYCSCSHSSSPPQSDDNMKKSSCDVLIVGAGISGLAAAKTLYDNGVKDIIILEAQSQCGGRIRSILHDDTWLELGAQWLHGKNNPVWQLAKENNLLSDITSVEGEGPYVRNDGVVFDTSLVDEVGRVIRDILQQCEKFSSCNNADIIPSSVGEYLDTEFKKYVDSCLNDTPEIRRRKLELHDWHIRYQVIDNSCQMLYSLSAKAWGEFVSSDEDVCMNFKSGYSSLIDMIVNSLPHDMVQLNTSVTLVKWSPVLGRVEGEEQAEELRPVTVTCLDGRQFTTSHAIITCSLGYLKQNYKEMFDPQLPSPITQAIEDMGFDTMNKIFLIYDEPWWSPHIKGYQLIWSLSQVDSGEFPPWTRDLTGFDVLPTRRAVLLGWVGGEGAIIVEQMSEEEVGNDCTSLLCKFLQRTDIPTPKKLIRSQWHSNKYVCGAYSNTSTLCDISLSKPSSLAEPVYSLSVNIQHPSILLAGEATHSSQYSTTHGAFISGQNQASVILNYKDKLINNNK